MRVRGLRSVAAYYVNRDFEVFWLDLAALGAKRGRGSEHYTIYFDKLLEWIKEYGIGLGNYSVSNYVLRFRILHEPPRTVTVLLTTLSRKGRVVYAVLAALAPGVLTSLNSLLTSAGWKSIFFLDTSLRHAHAHRMEE